MRRYIVFAISCFILFVCFTNVFAQDRALYIDEEKDGKSKQKFTMDFSKIIRPKSLDEFTKWTHLPPVTQDTTGTCWSFATTSFLESELARMGKEPVKLSEMYFVYWEYVEKARRFIQQKGDSNFGEGSEHNAVLRHMKNHGLVRQSDYSGLLSGYAGHNHSKLFKEVSSYLDYLEVNKIWDENQAIASVRLILNKYLGEPPTTIPVAGKEVTPVQYMTEVLELNPDDYISFMSLMDAPFYQQAEYKVPDNWWHSQEYYNVPLDEFYQAIVDAVKNGYTVALGGDTSEAGRNAEQDIAVIPSFDIAAKNIDQSAREFRFKNHTSTDDHAIHLVGYKKMGDHTWFLIKDSGRSGHLGKLKGYFMFRDDYIKLKMLNFLVHKSAVQNLINKFK